MTTLGNDWKQGLIDETAAVLKAHHFNIPSAEEVAPVLVHHLLVKMIDMGENTKAQAIQLAEDADKDQQLARAWATSAKTLSTIAQLILEVEIVEEDLGPKVDSQPEDGDEDEVPSKEG